MLPFTPQLQIITALCSVLISNPAKGRRLSWPVVPKYFGRLEHFCRSVLCCIRQCVCVILLLFWHAPLWVRSTICRHQPPQRAVLNQNDCFVQCEVVGSQISLDGVQPRDTGTWCVIGSLKHRISLCYCLLISAKSFAWRLIWLVALMSWHQSNQFN